MLNAALWQNEACVVVSDDALTPRKLLSFIWENFCQSSCGWAKLSFQVASSCLPCFKERDFVAAYHGKDQVNGIGGTITANLQLAANLVATQKNYH